MTESSVIHEGDDEYPLMIETNSDDRSEQKRYLPASALLKKSKLFVSFLYFSLFEFNYNRNKVQRFIVII